MTYIQLLNTLHELAQPYKSKGLREGQSVMNALHTLNYDMYRRIVATDEDPFYDDNLLDKFYLALKNSSLVDNKEA